MVTTDMSLVCSSRTPVAVISPAEWNRRLTQLHSRTSASSSSPAAGSRFQDWRRKIRTNCKRNWKTGVVALTYWLLWTGFSLYVLSNQ
jgi:hypothetical protein